MPESVFEPEFHELSTDGGWGADRLESLFRRFTQLSNPIFLDGCGEVKVEEELNRFSYLAAEPIAELKIDRNDSFAFEQLRELHQRYPFHRVGGLPPFQGGIAGLIAYEFNSRLEKVVAAQVDEFQVPQLVLFVYDVVLAIDHAQNRAWLISQGWPQSESSKRRECAVSRLRQFRELIEMEDPVELDCKLEQRIELSEDVLNPLESTFELYSDFSRAQFLAMVQKTVDYIRAGDIFQANLSQRLLSPATKSPAELYLDLRSVNPAPFSAYFDFGEGQVISASSERLVSMSKREIETRPIKGTRPRTHFPEVDLDTREALLNSEKDRAENTMIVDLLRNDLSRVAEPDSVHVSKLCGIEQFENVFHLVSTIKARLAEEFDAIDLIASLFPGGSITGAPKIRAMEIVSELEPTVRGAYCGSLGYVCPDGVMDFNILIRTITAKDGWWQIPVGGGIVSDSDPEKEYEETWAKAVGMLRAISRNRNIENRPEKPSIASDTRELPAV